MNKFYLLFLFMVAATATNAQSGAVDESFGNNGFVNTVINGTYNVTRATVVQPDGKIVVVGQAGEPSTYIAVAARFNTDGSIDTSFGEDGKVLMPIGSMKSFATDVALQADGKIVMSGYTWDNVTGDIFALRLNTDGTFDNSFGSNGVALVDNGSDVSEAVAIQDDGKILVGGYTNDNFTVARFNTDGSLDTTFGTNGWSITTFSIGSSYVKDVKIQNDGKIVLGGFLIDDLSIFEMALARLNSDGSIDNSFGTDGMVYFNIGNGNDFGEALAIQDDGKILLGGHKWISNIGLKHDLAVVRLNEDGTFDNTYGDNGVTTARLEDGPNYSGDIVLQDDGKLIIAGYTVRGTEYNLAMARFNTDGNLDDTFGVGGMVSTDFNQREDYGTAITLQPDNKIILAGYSYAPTGGSEVIVVRYENEVLGTEDFQNVRFNLFPNPANSQITVQLSDDSTSYELEIYDVSGKKVYASEIQSTTNINVSDFASGAYLVKLTSDNNSSVVRFVKQ